MEAGREAPAGVTGYYRFPSLHSDALAFISEDDVWTVGVCDNSSIAARLTSDGSATHPAISPDGAWVAYASDRACRGRFDVWLTPMLGGTSVRLTYEGVLTDPAMQRDLVVVERTHEDLRVCSMVRGRAHE